MSTVLILARLALVALFAVAAVAKLADLPGSRRALEGFGVAPRFVAQGAFALPAAELLAAILMLSPQTARAGAVAAAMLLAAFIAGILRALRQGRTPDCHCFGQLHSRPAGAETVARNAALLSLSLLVVIAGPGPSFAAWVADHDAAQVALLATGFVAAALAYSCLALWRENRRLTGHGGRAAEPVVPIEMGTRAPEVALVTLDGADVGSSDLLDGHTLLVFVSSSCGPCIALLPELARWKQMLVGRIAIHVVASGDEAEIRRFAEEHSFPVLLDLDATAMTAFGIPATPSAIEIDGDGAVASLPTSGGPAIEGLIRTALKRSSANFSLGVRHVGAESRKPSASRG